VVLPDDVSGHLPGTRFSDVGDRAQRGHRSRDGDEKDRYNDQKAYRNIALNRRFGFTCGAQTLSAGILTFPGLE